MLPRPFLEFRIILVLHVPGYRLFSSVHISGSDVGVDDTFVFVAVVMNQITSHISHS